MSLCKSLSKEQLNYSTLDLRKLTLEVPLLPQRLTQRCFEELTQKLDFGEKLSLNYQFFEILLGKETFALLWFMSSIYQA